MPSNSSNHSPDRKSFPSTVTKDHSNNGKSTDKETERDPSSAKDSRQPWLIALGVALLVALGYGGWRWWQSRTASPPEQATPAQAVNVELETVEPATVQETSTFIGNLVAPESVAVSPEIEGRVNRIYVEEGAQVETGDPLVQLRPDRQSAELASLQAALNSAQAQRESAQAQLQSLQSERGAAAAEVELQNEQYRRREFLVQEGALAREELDLVERDRQTATADLRSLDDRIQAARASLNQANANVEEAQADVEAARTQLQYTTVEAPFAGEVGNIDTKLGQYVSPGDRLTSVTQNDPLELELAVPVERRSDLRVGIPIELSDPQGNPIGAGQLTFVSPQVNSSSQTILVQARFSNPDGQLRDGQDVQAQIIWDERLGVLVPVVAVTRLGGQAFVYVAEAAPEEGQAQEGSQLVAQQIPVTLGEIQNNSYPVIEGIEAGDRIVISGILNLSDGTPIAPQAQNRSQDQAPAASQ